MLLSSLRRCRVAILGTADTVCREREVSLTHSTGTQATAAAHRDGQSPQWVVFHQRVLAETCGEGRGGREG